MHCQCIGRHASAVEEERAKVELSLCIAGFGSLRSQNLKAACTASKQRQSRLRGTYLGCVPHWHWTRVWPASGSAARLIPSHTTGTGSAIPASASASTASASASGMMA